MQAANPGVRKELNKKFEALADEIKRKHCQEGKKVVDQAVARRMQMQRPRWAVRGG